MGVFLVSSGISYDSDPSVDELTGTGDLVWLDLNTDNPGGLSADTYTWSGTKTIGTITDARSGTGYDIATNSGQSVQGSSGTVTISGDPPEWTIELSLDMSDGKSVIGSYTGVVDTTF